MQSGSWDRWTAEHPGVAFMLGNGVFGVVAGAVLLFGDARVIPHGWSCTVIACGMILLAGAAVELLGIELSAQPSTVVAALLVLVFFTLTALYFTHPAEDLPRFLAGHDGDSQHLRVFYGTATALAGCLALGWTYRLTSPHRRPRVTTGS